MFLLVDGNWRQSASSLAEMIAPQADCFEVHANLVLDGIYRRPLTANAEDFPGDCRKSA